MGHQQPVVAVLMHCSCAQYKLACVDFCCKYTTRMVGTLYISLHIYLLLLLLVAQPVIRLPVANIHSVSSSLLNIFLFRITGVHQTKTHIIAPSVVHHICSQIFILLAVYKQYLRFQLSAQSDPWTRLPQHSETYNSSIVVDNQFERDTDLLDNGDDETMISSDVDS